MLHLATSRSSRAFSPVKDVSFLVDNSGSVSWGGRVTPAAVFEKVLSESSRSVRRVHDNVVYWGTSVSRKYISAGNHGGTNPEVLSKFPDDLTRPVIVFMTDGKISDSAVRAFDLLVGDNFKKAVKVIIVIAGEFKSPADMNLSVVSTLMANNPNTVLLASDPKGNLRHVSKAYDKWENAELAEVKSFYPGEIVSREVIEEVPEDSQFMGYEDDKALYFNQAQMTVDDLNEQVLSRLRISGGLDMALTLVKSAMDSINDHVEDSEASRAMQRAHGLLVEGKVAEARELIDKWQGQCGDLKKKVKAKRAHYSQLFNMISELQKGSWSCSNLKLGSNRARRTKRFPRKSYEYVHPEEDALIAECECCCNDAPCALLILDKSETDVEALTSDFAIDVPLGVKSSLYSRYKVCVSCAEMFVRTGMDAYRNPVLGMVQVVKSNNHRHHWPMLTNLCRIMVEGRKMPHLYTVLLGDMVRNTDYAPFVKSSLDTMFIRLNNTTPLKTLFKPAFDILFDSSQNNPEKLPIYALHTISELAKVAGLNGEPVSKALDLAHQFGAVKRLAKVYRETSTYKAEELRQKMVGDYILARYGAVPTYKSVEVHSGDDLYTDYNPHLTFDQVNRLLSLTVYQVTSANSAWQSYLMATPMDRETLFGSSADIPITFIPFVINLGRYSSPSVLNCGVCGEPFTNDLTSLNIALVINAERSKHLLRHFGYARVGKGSTFSSAHRAVAEMLTDNPDLSPEEAATEVIRQTVARSGVGARVGSAYHEGEFQLMVDLCTQFKDLVKNSPDLSDDDDAVTRSLAYKIQAEISIR